MAPALFGPQVYITYADLLDKIARISNVLAARRIPRRAKVYLNISEPNLRLLAALACLHYGLIPFIVLELGNIADEVDHDLVIGSTNPHHPKLPSDIVIDNALLNGPGVDAKLRDFPTPGNDEIMFIATTTGTTGRRKLVAQTYGMRASRAPAGRRFEAGDRVMFTIGDVTQYGFTLSYQILLGGGAIARKVQNMRENIGVISRYSVNRMIATPIALERMMDFMEADSVRLPSLKQISITGSLFHTALVERLERMFSAEIIVAYGSSESGGISRGVVTSEKFRAGYVGELMEGVKLMSAGTPDRPAQLTIINDRSRIGGYYSRGQVIPDNTPFYALPDLGYVQDGALYLVGRDDEVYNVSGNKIAFSRIESAVRGVPGIRDAAVCGGGELGDPVALLIAVVADGSLNAKDVTASIVELTRLPRMESSLKVFRLSEIPRNDMGKVDRGGVVRAYLAQAGTTSATPAGGFPETVGNA